MLLEKLALPKFEAKIIDEINGFRDLYNKIDTMNIADSDKLQKKKKIISDSVFEIFVGIFNLDYDVKLRFNSKESDAICVDINNDFDTIFLSIS